MGALLVRRRSPKPSGQSQLFPTVQACRLDRWEYFNNGDREGSFSFGLHRHRAAKAELQDRVNSSLAYVRVRSSLRSTYTESVLLYSTDLALVSRTARGNYLGDIKHH